MDVKMVILLIIALGYWLAPDTIPGPVDDALVAVLSALTSIVLAAAEGEKEEGKR